VRRHFWIFGALLLGGFHLAFIVLPLLASGGQGEGQAFLVMFADFPLVWLLDRIPGGGHILYNSKYAYLAFFSIAGTLMYACAGALLGRLVALGFRRKEGARLKDTL
jgi:hypothetical protein